MIRDPWECKRCLSRITYAGGSGSPLTKIIAKEIKLANKQVFELHYVCVFEAAE